MRFLRSLDGIFYALVAFAVLILHDLFGVISLSIGPSLYTAIPLAGVFLATLKLPSKVGRPGFGVYESLPLKFLAAGLLGLYPFACWQAQGTRSVYLTIGAAAALILGCLYGLELLRLLEFVFLSNRRYKLKVFCRHLRGIIYYLFLIPTATVYAFVIFHMMRRSTTANRLLGYAWGSLETPFRMSLLLLSAACGISLLFLLCESRDCIRANLENTETAKA
ncbi:MAG: hypothetical protein R6V56_08755 [Lentisphaeria bacterium]